MHEELSLALCIFFADFGMHEPQQLARGQTVFKILSTVLLLVLDKQATWPITPWVLFYVTLLCWILLQSQPGPS